MKWFVLVALLLISPLAIAADIAVEDYIAAEVKMLETQIDQLNAAINLMSSESLTEAEKFERIGEPSFTAVENAMTESGFTIQQFYAYRERYNAEIGEWLSEHEQTAGNIESLQTELERLSEQYDQLINVDSGK